MSYLGIGFVGLLHNSTEAPIMDYEGLYLSPGYKYRLSYKLSFTSYLNSPYGQCKDDVPQNLKLNLNYYPNADYGYSQSLCLQNNIQVYV